MQIVKCVMVSLWLLVSIIALSLFLAISWFSGRRVLRITSIIFSTICFAVCMVTGIWLLMVNKRLVACFTNIDTMPEHYFIFDFEATLRFSFSANITDYCLQRSSPRMYLSQSSKQSLLNATVLRNNLDMPNCTRTSRMHFLHKLYSCPSLIYRIVSSVLLQISQTSVIIHLPPILRSPSGWTSLLAIREPLQ